VKNPKHATRNTPHKNKISGNKLEYGLFWRNFAQVLGVAMIVINPASLPKKTLALSSGRKRAQADEFAWQPPAGRLGVRLRNRLGARNPAQSGQNSALSKRASVRIATSALG
jgi:hypothetical protein